MSSEASEPVDLPLEVGGLLIQPGDRIGQYVYRRVIGRGGMAHVALASDPDGQPIALKILKTGRVGTGLQRFRREFRALARLRHPNVIRVDAYGDIHGHPYIAMEYVDGKDLHGLIHQLQKAPEEERWLRCEQVLTDICRSLTYIHAHGLVHRDLKPSNVLIDSSGRCKLTDFGIVKDLDPDHDSQASVTLVGTWAYASPEQVNGQPVDHRSDLFSLGVILFAMLTGRRPFVAKDLAGYIELHRNLTPPLASEVEPCVPPHLDDLCRRLLAHEPQRRPRGAQELLYRLEARALSAAEPTLQPDAPLVGRQGVIDRLGDAVAGLSRGEGGLLILEGEEGSGRSRLLAVAGEAARASGVPVHSVRVTRPDGPTGVLLRLLDSVRKLAPADEAAALEAAAQGAVDSPGGTARATLFRTLAVTVARISREGPQVILVDDAHEALLPAIDGLLALARALATERVLMVLAMDASVRTPRLDAMRALGARVVVGSLGEPDAISLAASMLGAGRPAQAVGARLFRETGGNPGAIVDWLQDLIDTGIVVRVGRGHRLGVDAEELASGHLDVPASVLERVRPRIDALDLADRNLAEALAVYGHEVELDVLLSVLGLDEDTALDGVGRLDQDGLVRSRVAGPQTFVRLMRPLDRTALYRALDPERRAHLHGAFAVALESQFGTTVTATARVGEHWARAGQAGKAYRRVVEGAATMRERGQNAEAWELTELADAYEETARVDLGVEEFSTGRHLLLLVRADVLYLRGKWAAARACLEQSVQLAVSNGNERGALRARMRLARVLRTAGQVDQADLLVTEHLPRARELGEREAVAEGLLARAHIAWTRGDLDKVERYAQEGLVQAGTQHPRARADLLLAATAVQAGRGQLASAATGLNEAQTLYRDLRMHGMRANALANLAEVELGQGDPVGAWEHGADALAETEAEGPGFEGAPGVGARMIRGLAALELGAWAEARAELEGALTRAEALGMTGTLLACSVHLARARLALGDAAGALSVLADPAGAFEKGDPERFLAVAAGLRARACTALRDGPEARKWLAQAEALLAELPPQRRVETALDMARALERLGDAAAALPLAQAAARLAQTRGFRILGLDSVALAARVTPDAAESNRLSREAQQGYAQILARLPSMWQATFRARGAGA
jgi:tetratricopeptide (TPR) repeat protein